MPFPQKILILGKHGQLARAFANLLPNADVLGSGDLDLSQDAQTIDKGLEAYKGVELVINTAAYTQVDKAETERDVAKAINAVAPGVLARWCRMNHALLVHISTDYVFDGNGLAPRNETDSPVPVNYYGLSKWWGEQAVQEAYEAQGHYLLFRTSWVYDAEGNNFLRTMLTLMQEKETLRVVADQKGSPTYAPHLAQAIVAVLRSACAAETFPGGLYHLCAEGVTSWHGFAQQIHKIAQSMWSESIVTQRVEPITTADYPLPAKRPLNSQLDCTKALSMFNVKLPPWQEGVEACMERMNACKSLSH